VVRAAEPEAPAVDDVVELMEDDSRGNRRLGADKPEFKHFLPLPLPSHLVYIKPTVAVVAGTASRSSVGLKMTAGDNQLERYVIEFYSKVSLQLDKRICRVAHLHGATNNVATFRRIETILMPVLCRASSKPITAHIPSHRQQLLQAPRRGSWRAVSSIEFYGSMGVSGVVDKENSGSMLFPQCFVE
jgi:hypothetical protein